MDGPQAVSRAGEAEVAAPRRRSELFERLSRIQRSISHRAPLQDVLDAITSGACELLGDEVCGLRLIDPEDPGFLEMVASHGVTPEQADILRRTPVGKGAGGLAITRDEVVIIEGYAEAPGALPVFAAHNLQAAMSAPVREGGQAVGSLTVATYRPGRSYSPEEQEALEAFAEYAGLALADARAVEAMREAQQAKDMFLAMVSHELKTPLTVIMGTLRTMQKHLETLPARDREEMLEAAYLRSVELERLIDRLLQSTRAELAGAKQHVFLPDLLADSVSGFDTRRIQLREVPERVVLVDAVSVQKIVGILLENAISHSHPESGITVEVISVTGEVSIVVRNVGSLPEGLDHATLFLPFQRGPSPRSSGVGLGLYIASRLAAAIGGRLSADSGGGTVTFTLHFPTGADLSARG